MLTVTQDAKRLYPCSTKHLVRANPRVESPEQQCHAKIVDRPKVKEGKQDQEWDVLYDDERRNKLDAAMGNKTA